MVDICQCPFHLFLLFATIPYFHKTKLRKLTKMINTIDSLATNGIAASCAYCGNIAKQDVCNEAAKVEQLNDQFCCVEKYMTSELSFCDGSSSFRDLLNEKCCILIPDKFANDMFSMYITCIAINCRFWACFCYNIFIST